MVSVEVVVVYFVVKVDAMVKGRDIEMGKDILKGRDIKMERECCFWVWGVAGFAERKRMGIGRWDGWVCCLGFAVLRAWSFF